MSNPARFGLPWKPFRRGDRFLVRAKDVIGTVALAATRSRSATVNALTTQLDPSMGPANSGCAMLLTGTVRRGEF